MRCSVLRSQWCQSGVNFTLVSSSTKDSSRDSTSFIARYPSSTSSSAWARSALRRKTNVRSAFPGVSGYLTTMFSILSGTWITFSTSLSSICLRTELSASAAALTESSSAPLRQVRRARSLPLTCTAMVTSFSTLLSGSKSGHGAFKTNYLLPRACHSSSEICGANGASSRINRLKVSMDTPPCAFASLTKIMS